MVVLTIIALIARRCFSRLPVELSDMQPFSSARAGLRLLLNRRVFAGTYLCLFTFLFSSMPTRADLIWGVNGHPFAAYPGISYAKQLDQVKAIGARSYRVDINSADTAPALDRLLAEASARGIEILPVITPKIDLQSETADAIYQKAYDLARILVSRFKNRIRVWELGNEMENYAIIQPCETRDDGTQYPCEWGPAGGTTPPEYYGPRWTKVSAALRGLSDGTIAADPTVLKAMGTAGWGHTGAFLRMQQDGIRWDISVWHMYGQDPEWAFKFLSSFNRPIWVTEFNNRGGSHASEPEQADGLIRAMTRLRQLYRTYNVQAAHVYELLDEPYWAPSYEASMGLVNMAKNEAGSWSVGRQKLAYHVVKHSIQTTNALEFLTGDCHLNATNKLDSENGMRLSYSYCLILNRSIDGAGSDSWSAALKKGTSLQEVLMALLESDEFKLKYGTRVADHRSFAISMYRLLLGRDPDGAGFFSYMAQLQSGSLSRAALLTALIGSDEFALRHPILRSSSNFPIPSSSR